MKSRKKSMRRLTRKYLIALPPKPKEQKILSQFCTASAKWNVSVRDVETFMYPSLAYENNLENPMPLPQLQWKEEKIYQTEQTEYPDLEKLRLDEIGRERAAFDQKLEFAEKLLRQQALKAMRNTACDSEDEDESCDPIVETPLLQESKEQELTITCLDPIKATANRRQRVRKKQLSNMTAYKELSSKTSLFRKWNRIVASRQHGIETNTPRHLSPRSTYFEACTVQSIIPEPLFIRINMSGCFELGHFGLGNERAIVLGKSLKDLPFLEQVDFADNRLTHEAVVVILGALEGRKGLKKINLSENFIGSIGCDALAHFLETTVLKELNLSNTKLNDKAIAPVTAQVERHSMLCVLNLSHNEIGSDGGELIGQMIANSCCLRDIDISWNRISGAGAISIGKALKKSSLERINLSLNRFGDSGGEQVGAALLSPDCKLRELNISRNNLGDRSTIILAYGTSVNQTLATLNLDANSIGTTGARAIISSLATGSKCQISMAEIDFEIFYNSSSFDMYLPTAHSPYMLDLENSPYDYVIACKLMEASAEYFLCSLHDIVYSNESQSTTLEYSERSRIVLTHDRKPWTVPTHGTLAIACTLTPTVPTDSQIIRSEAVQCVIDFVRRGITQREMSSLLKVALTDIYLTTAQVDGIFTQLKDVIEPVELLMSLLLRVVDGENSFDIIRKHLSWEGWKRMFNTYGAYTCSFNSKNPSGHWSLDLADRNHRIIAIWLAKINGKESACSRSNETKHGDTSEHGDWNNWRQAKFNGKRIALENSFFEKLPSKGVLEFYYIGTTRPNRRTATAMTDEELTQLLVEIHAEVCSDYISVSKRNLLKYQVSALSVAVSGKYFTTEQVNFIIAHFPKNYESNRVKVICAVFQSILDFENFHIVLDKLNATDRGFMYTSFGYLNIVNPLRPQMDYICDLQFNDCRILVRSFMDAALLDPRDAVRVNTSKSSVQAYELYAIASMPTKGTFCFKYNAYNSNKAVASKARMGILKAFLVAESY